MRCRIFHLFLLIILSTLVESWWGRSSSSSSSRSTGSSRRTSVSTTRTTGSSAKSTGLSWRRSTPAKRTTSSTRKPTGLSRKSTGGFWRRRTTRLTRKTGFIKPTTQKPKVSTDAKKSAQKPKVSTDADKSSKNSNVSDVARKYNNSKPTGLSRKSTGWFWRKPTTRLTRKTGFIKPTTQKPKVSTDAKKSAQKPKVSTDADKSAKNSNVSDIARKYNNSKPTGLSRKSTGWFWHKPTTRLTRKTGFIKPTTQKPKVSTDAEKSAQKPKVSTDADKSSKNSNVYDVARNYINSTKWSKDAIWNNINTTQGKYKCNLFVGDMLRDANVKVPSLSHNHEPILANEWANSKSKYILETGMYEQVKPGNMKEGDIVAFKRNGESGHVGIVSKNGKFINAGTKQIVETSVANLSNDDTIKATVVWRIKKKS